MEKNKNQFFEEEKNNKINFSFDSDNEESLK